MQIGVGVLLVDADAAFHRNRNIDRRAHRRDAIGDQRRFAHQARAETPRLHAIRRTSHVEINFVVAVIDADARRRSEVRWIVSTELQGDGMFRHVESEQAIAIAVQCGAGRHHLGIQTRMRRQQTVEITAMPVCPIHHGSYAKRVRARGQSAWPPLRLGGKFNGNRPGVSTPMGANWISFNKLINVRASRSPL